MLVVFCIKCIVMFSRDAYTHIQIGRNTQTQTERQTDRRPDKQTARSMIVKFFKRTRNCKLSEPSKTSPDIIQTHYIRTILKMLRALLSSIKCIGFVCFKLLTLASIRSHMCTTCASSGRILSRNIIYNNLLRAVFAYTTADIQRMIC